MLHKSCENNKPDTKKTLEANFRAKQYTVISGVQTVFFCARAWLTDIETRGKPVGLLNAARSINLLSKRFLT
ncbi:uncharacterized protein PHALS_13698 [Plasmopara halstedii]|uniref:Uncharacterized protein n=1 Tax=Plasmopara halstedii TaxID=4781 RepID=A0A0P1AQU4_PLAHL|nr:uncharacterized protein PHALS_13698 [Plasmopara halstedii]CEG43505.1 hypothetical protein PHALS_13698 [Plasmopara halstedii]|eukprot:XP_024579874.1 hypothetical protein PHALS_13698 [Plasmopara halstedii]